MNKTPDAILGGGNVMHIHSLQQATIDLSLRMASMVLSGNSPFVRQYCVFYFVCYIKKFLNKKTFSVKQGSRLLKIPNFY